MKRLVSALAVFVLALGLVACGGGGSSTSDGTSSSGIEPASERLEHTEEGCVFAEEELAEGKSGYHNIVAECHGEEEKLRAMVERGEGDSTRPTGP